MCSKTVHRQAGVALISVLLVFALATVIASEVMRRSYLDVRKTANVVNSKQAYHFALSGEQYARQILYRDHYDSRQQASPSDGFSDTWAMNFEPFDIEGGEMAIEIHDLQGRYNLNNLVDTTGYVRAGAVQRFQRLQQQLGMGSDYTPALVDWMDADGVPLPGGAEDEAYDDYLPANRPLSDRSELRQLRDMSGEDYELLAPLVVTLPKRLPGQAFGHTQYNINTANAKLLQALTGLSDSQVRRIVDRQRQGGYDTLQQWLDSPAGAGLADISEDLTVQSAFFEVVVTANYQQRVSVLTTHLYRDPGDGSIIIIKRQIGSG